MSRVQSKRFWVGGGCLVAAVIVIGGWFAVISPQLSSASSLREQSDSADQQNSLLQSKVANLKRQNDKLPTITANLREALAALPLDSGLPAFTRQLSAQAAQHRVSITSIAVGSIVPTTSAGTSSPGTTGSTAEVAGTVFAIPVTLISTGGVQNQLALLKAIQVDGPRRALVVSTQLAPPTGTTVTSTDASSTMTTQLTVFSAPLSPQAQSQLKKLLSGNISD